MMTISVTSNIEAVKRRMDDVQRKQIPFAASVAINDTLKELRDEEMRGMQQDLDRPTPFTTKGVQYRKSSKASLTGALFIEGKRTPYLKYQISGGIRTPKGKVLIIGTGARNQYGNTPNFRHFRARLLGTKNHFEATSRDGTSGIWRRRGRGKNRTLELVALYTPMARYKPKRFDFYGRAMRFTKQRFPVLFDRALTKALATAH